jgi:hypothetical protein
LPDDATGAPVFLNDLAALFDSGLLTVMNDDNEGALQRLALLGLTGAAPSFIIPEGDPFPTVVPEPATLAVLGIGIFALGWNRRRVHCSRGT